MEIHSANLEYKRERDRVAAENSRISLLHQSAVVQAVSSLAKALARINHPQCVENPPLSILALTSTTDDTGDSDGDLEDNS